MTTSYPTTVPFPYSGDDTRTDAYRHGWNHGHGIACHNVPRIGEKLFIDGMGRLIVNEENIREVHANLCYSAEENSRCYSPFAFTAHEFNSAETDEDGNWDSSKEGISEELWEAFDAGTNDAIAADLATYTDDDYGIEAKEETD